MRNDIRFIATGSGSLNELYVEHVPHSVDIQEGDLLVSSGLGGVFPEGYPVARVTQVVRDESRPFARVIVTPTASLDRLRHLLLLWQEGDDRGESVDEIDGESEIEPEEKVVEESEDA